jgi:hypothetical protein
MNTLYNLQFTLKKNDKTQSILFLCAPLCSLCKKNLKRQRTFKFNRIVVKSVHMFKAINIL